MSFDDISPEILLHVMSFMDIPTLYGRFSGVSRTIHNMVLTEKKKIHYTLSDIQHVAKSEMEMLKNVSEYVERIDMEWDIYQPNQIFFKSCFGKIVSENKSFKVHIHNVNPTQEFFLANVSYAEYTLHQL